MSSAGQSKQSKPIGSLNGPWSIMLRIALATYPILLPWCVWVTTETYESKAFRAKVKEDSFSQLDGAHLKEAILDGQQTQFQAIVSRLTKIETLLKVDEGRR